MSRIVIMGAPGVGKGTQAALLAESLGVPHITTGGLFRDQIARETELGMDAAATLASGGYVSDEVTTSLLRERLAEDDTEHGFVLDGYPRTLAQVEALDQLLAERGEKVERVILLRTDVGIILTRLAGRAAQGRSDDSLAVVRARLAVYTEHTEPIARVYEGRGILQRIDATASVERVAEAVQACVSPEYAL